MKFGLFYEHQIPRPRDKEQWDPDAEHKMMKNALDQIELADELGFDYIFQVEHHFLEEYSHSSAPEIFLTAVAAVTQNIRVGHGIVTCVPQMNNPIRIAERAAMLDHLSDGRLEFGTGRSSTWTELGGFEADPDETKKTWDEFVRIIPRMWMEERFSYQGRFFSMPSRMVLPKPYQDPHPPMWVAVTSPGTEQDAAARGLGSLGVSSGSFDETARKTEAYHGRIQACDPVGGFGTAQTSTLNFLYCHEDDDTGMQVGQRMHGYFGYLNSQLVTVREVYPTRSYPTLGAISVARDETGGRPDRAQTVCFGGPDRIIEVVKRWEQVGIDQINFLLNTAEVISHEDVLASLRLFGERVIPAFKEGARHEAAPATVDGGA